MAVSRTLFPESVSWSEYTWDASSGGPVSVSFVLGGREIADYAGTDLYPRSIQTVDRRCEVSVRLRDPGAVDGSDLGTTDSIIIKLAVPEEVTITFAGMKLIEIAGAQDRGEPGAITLRFVHESSDGQTAPITIGAGS